MTELFNTNGKKIGEDKKGKDGTVSIILDRKKAKQIADNYKKGILVSKNEVNAGVLLTKVILEEALNVLKRTENNGGLREECSIITETGKVIKGKRGELPKVKNGVQIAETSLPKLSDDESMKSIATIHSHPILVQELNGFYYPQTATEPTFHPDLWVFVWYKTNIIVGNLVKPNIRLGAGKVYVSKPKRGAAIYKRCQGDKPVLILGEKAIEKIIK